MSNGMTQSYFLNQFVDEIVRTNGAALAGKIPPPTRAALFEEFRGVALRAAQKLFGTETPIDVTISDDLGDVNFYQVLEAVDAPANPKRQVPLFALKRAGKEFAKIKAGQTFQLRIAYTRSPNERETNERLQKAVGGVLPLPVHSEELWGALTEELTAALLRYFPAPAFAENTLGALLQSGGAWTRGLSAKSGPWEIELERAYFDYYPTHVTSGWVDFGFVTVFRKNGVEIHRGGSGFGPSGKDPENPNVWLEAIKKGDNDGVVKSWAVLPSDERAKPAVLAALQEIADRLAAAESPNGHRDTSALLAAALRPPIRGGLFEWMQEALPRLLVGHAHEVTLGKKTVRFELTAVRPPAIGLEGFGRAAVVVAASSSAPDLDVSPEPSAFSIGGAGPEILDLRGPESDAERRDLEEIVRRFGEWVDATLDARAAERGFEGIESGDFLYGLPGHFSLIDLLEARIKQGPPVAPPVPPFGEEELSRAARTLKRVRGVARKNLAVQLGYRKGAMPLAAFVANGWTILLDEDEENGPWGSSCGISIVPPGEHEPSTVMMVDAWNPPARLVVDGDAFAFRRFLEWLRGGVQRGDLDVELTFARGGDEDGGDEDEDGDGDGDGETEIRMHLSDWLLFGLPDTGDRFLVDWRAQWHVVSAGTPVTAFAGIYGFTGATLERFETRCIPLWRRFLREVVDPRFA